MAHVTISRQWPDGEILHVCVDAESSYPDAVSEAKRTALDTFREATETTMGVGLRLPEDDDA